MDYKVKECFYSLQGEGVWTGCPMYFIRLAGCNLQCDFCDTKFDGGTIQSCCDLLGDLEENGASHLLITGGEPTLQNLVPLVKGAHDLGVMVHLETNGSVQTNIYPKCEWVTLSPKVPNEVQPEAWIFANEVKIPWDGGPEYGPDFVESVLGKAQWRKEQRLYLQPINGTTDILWNRVQSAIQYCKERPDMDLSVNMQMHKLWRIS